MEKDDAGSCKSSPAHRGGESATSTVAHGADGRRWWTLRPGEEITVSLRKKPPELRSLHYLGDGVPPVRCTGDDRCVPCQSGERPSHRVSLPVALADGPHGRLDLPAHALDILAAYWCALGDDSLERVLLLVARSADSPGRYSITPLRTLTDDELRARDGEVDA